MSPFYCPAAGNCTGSGFCWAILLPGCRKNHSMGAMLSHFTARPPEKSLSGGFVGHIACCVSSLPTTSLPIADFACNLPDFLAFLIGIGRMKIFHSFSAQNQLSFWTFEEIVAPYAHIRPTNSHSGYTSVHFGAFEAYSTHMPKINSPASQLSFKTSLFPGERLHS